MSRDWNSKDVAYLKRYGRNRTVSELAAHFETDSVGVAAQLKELGLTPKPELAIGGSPLLGNEPLLVTYEEGIQAFHGDRKSESKNLFQKVVDECDQPELQHRARQYLSAIARDEQTDADPTDPFLMAVYQKNLGQLDAALATATDDAKLSAEERFTYLIASIHSLQSNLDDAAKLLGSAIEMNPKNRVYAFHDPDFDGLRESGEHAEIFGLE